MQKEKGRMKAPGTDWDSTRSAQKGSWLISGTWCIQLSCGDGMVSSVSILVAGALGGQFAEDY